MKKDSSKDQKLTLVVRRTRQVIRTNIRGGGHTREINTFSAV